MKDFPWEKQCHIEENQFDVNISNILNLNNFEETFGNELDLLIKRI